MCLFCTLVTRAAVRALVFIFCVENPTTTASVWRLVAGRAFNQIGLRGYGEHASYGTVVLDLLVTLERTLAGPPSRDGGI